MIQIPGKIFLFGEYAVMQGGEAVIAAVSPHYRAQKEGRLHPDSPAAVFLQEQGMSTPLQITDGPGRGFGSSTAELIAANQIIAKPMNPADLWAWYRERFYPASGADLAVQSIALKEGTGFYQFQIQGDSFRVQKLNVPYLFQSNCLVFQCPPSQKIPTHTYLEKQQHDPLDHRITNSFIHRWLDGFDPRLMNEWAEHLAQSGRESLFARDVRKAFTSIDGVVGVKGCGAGMNDVFLVSMDQANPIQTLKSVHRVAEHLELKFLGALHERV
jgi:hypothetical protein